MIKQSETGHADKALGGLRVLDLTQVMAGPYSTMVLGDMGADVIKIEQPGSGDQTRSSWGSPSPGKDSRAFMALNRNKRSVALNLKSDAGREDFYELVRTADVVIENFRPGVTSRLRIDYPTIAAINDRIIYTSITGFGQDGPYSSRPGYDLIAQAMGGVMSITGEPGGRPVKAGLPVGDLGAGLFAAIGILAAVNWRNRTGKGQFIETSLFESVLALSVWESVEYWDTGETPRPLGSANRMAAPYQALQTRDGYVTIGANNERLWNRLCEAIGLPSLAQDTRFATNSQRMANRHELIDVLEQVFRERGTDEWVRILLDVGVPAGPIQNYRELLTNDPHVRARGMIDGFDHPVDGRVNVVRSPIRMSRTPPRVHRAAPLLGEHSPEVLNESRSSSIAGGGDK